MLLHAIDLHKRVPQIATMRTDRNEVLREARTGSLHRSLTSDWEPLVFVPDMYPGRLTTADTCSTRVHRPLWCMAATGSDDTTRGIGCCR